MKKCLLLAKGFLATVLFTVCALTANATAGAPHTLKATANYNTVLLDWEAPADDIKLKWHSEYDYDAADGISYNSEEMTAFYVSNYFEAEDLKNFVGKQVKSISYMQYRAVYKVTALVYVNGKVVSTAVDDQANFDSGEEKEIVLDTPVTIPAGASMRFAVKFECGSNMDMVASRDNGPAVFGKGDCISFDGETWSSDNGGNFWVTAHLVNDATQSADGYNVYCDGVKINTELITETEFEATNQSKGVHNYTVSAVYGAEEVESYSVSATVNVFPAPSILSVDNNLFTNTISWQAPLLNSGTLTWSNQELLNGIGGTSTSSPKIWIKNEFDAADLISFVGSQLSAVNVFFFKEESSEVSSCVVYVVENDKIVYSEEMSSDALAAIKLGEWNKLPLATPYEIKAGNKVAYGIYITHTKKKHPLAYDTCPVGNIGKGTMYSTSSPKSTFNNSAPTWKSLSDAGITGNWMLTADIAGSTDMKLAGYDVYRNGAKIASAITETTYVDEVSAPGFYEYGIVAVAQDGSVSDASSAILEVALPESYRAPYIEQATFDEKSKKFDLVWSMDAEIRHYNTPTYVVGFEEDMSLMAGTKFTKAELAQLKGFSIKRLTGLLYDEVGDFKIGVYSPKGAVLAEATIASGAYTPGYTFSVDLPTGVEITGEEELCIAYTLNMKGGTTPLVIDEGPLVENGALVSFTNGNMWMKLSNINSSANDHNFVIGALATPPSASQSRAHQSKSYKLGNIPVEEVESASPARTRSAVSNAPQFDKFNVYCNNKLIATTAAFNYTETLTKFGPYTYEVSAVYTNGWESPRSEMISFSNSVEQKNPAPFDLSGAVSNDDLVLSWSSTDKATVLTYETGDTDNAFQLSGSGSGFYAITRYSVKDLADKVGMKVSHIRFKLATNNVYTLNAVVMYGDNIVYSQPVDTKKLVVGYNSVRLDNPVEIPAGWEVGVGYMIDGPTGVAMMVMDGGPAVEMYGDVYSTSGSSWYSMKKKNKQDYNWRISATLMADDQTVHKSRSSKVNSDAPTYNVYKDGELIAEGLADTQYTVSNAASGRYYVTATSGTAESAESNAVVYVADSATGVGNVYANANDVTYNAATQTISSNAVADINVYTTSGALVKSASGVTALNIADLANGIYVVAVTVDGATTTTKILK